MIRFVDLRGQGLEARFAFWNTVTDRFLSLPSQAWKDWQDFKEAAREARPVEDLDLDRFRGLCPPWVFEPPTDAELGFPEDQDQPTCTTCTTCGAPFVSHGFTAETLVGYGSPPGHDHDDNCLTRIYTCANGHFHQLSLRRRCSVPGCGWTGKETCSCHPGLKVDAWPEAPARPSGRARIRFAGPHEDQP